MTMQIDTNNPTLALRNTDDSGVSANTAETSNTQEPLSFHARTQMTNFLQQRGLTEEQASRFTDNFMQPNEVREFLGVISGQRPITQQGLKDRFDLNEEHAQFVLQGEQSLQLSPAGEGRHGGVLVTSHPFGSIFVEFMALMYSLGVDVRKMIAKTIEVQKKGMIDAANSQFHGAIGKFAASMTAGLLSLGGGVANAWRTKNKAPAEKSSNEDNATKSESNNAESQSTATERNRAVNEALNNTWTSPQGLALITQPVTAAGDFVDAWFQKEAGHTNAEVEEARSILQQLMSFYDQTKNSQQAAAQGAG